MPILADPAAGRTLRVDLSSGSRTDPADLPAHTVQEGLPATFRRTPLPTECEVEAILSDIPGEGQPRAEVVEWIDEAARTARRLRLVIAGIPDTSGLMVGTRTYSTVEGSTTTKMRIALTEVRVITSARGDVAFPTPRADLRSGRTSTAEQGEAPTQPASPEQAREGVSWGVFFGGAS